MSTRLLRWLAALLLATSFTVFPGTAVQQPVPKSAEQPKAQTVYITRTGKRYHRDGCRYLASSKIPMALKDAKVKGYTPCKVCHPPE